MKNMKMTVKLSVSFLIVIAFAVIVGGMGIYGIQQINTEETHLYEDYTQPLPYIGKVSEIIQRMRVDANEYLIGALTGDMDKVENARSCMQNHIGDIPDYLNMYRATIKDVDALLIFDETRTLYDEDFLPSMERCYELAKAGDSSGVLDEMDAIRPTILKIAEDFNACMETKTVLAGETSLNGDSYARMLTILVISTLAIGMAVSVFLIFYISGLISKPLGMMSKALNQMGTEGDLALSPEMAKSAAECAAWKDEIGLCARAVGGLIGHLNNIQDDLARVADGDLTISINTLSERDSIGLSVSKLVDSLNEMFGEINSSATQLSAGSKQIADGAQSLAQGTTEQASAVEELSSSIAEIDKKTKDNAEMADKAALLANSIMLNAEKGSRQMDEMMTAVRDINEASQSINKVIKVIDNIAFQTNILALNAAVEAARAGQHGKGFAVVAEEVRSLAAKSAEAAKDTENLIANSIEKAELGARITDETAASLKEIVSGISESAKLVKYIAKSSDEQSVGISQINTGINQVAQVVHKNSATAQESAAASEEMSGQAGILESLVAQFMLKNSGAVRFHSLPPAGKSAHETLTMPGYGAH